MECSLCIYPLLLQAYGYFLYRTLYIVQHTLPFAMKLIILNNICYAYEFHYTVMYSLYL